jgi:hypothetical protein
VFHSHADTIRSLDDIHERDAALVQPADAVMHLDLIADPQGVPLERHHRPDLDPDPMSLA